MQQLDTAPHRTESGATEPPPDRVVRDDAEIYKITGIRKSLRYELMRRGEFPQSVQITPRCVGFIERELHQWVRDLANSRVQRTKVGQA